MAWDHLTTQAADVKAVFTHIAHVMNVFELTSLTTSRRRRREEEMHLRDGPAALSDARLVYEREEGKEAMTVNEIINRATDIENLAEIDTVNGQFISDLARLVKELAENVRDSKEAA